MHSVFVYARGLNRRPSWASSDRTGEEGDADDQKCEEARPAHLLDGADDSGTLILRIAGSLQLFELLVGLFDHHDGGVHQGPHRDGDSAERHDARTHPQRAERQERNEHHDRNGDDRDYGAK